MPTPAPARKTLTVRQPQAAKPAARAPAQAPRAPAAPPAAPTATRAQAGQNLAHTLAACAQVLHGVMAGQSWSTALLLAPAHLRPGVQALGFVALRHWGLAQTLRNLLITRPPPPLADALLCLALALLALPEEAAPYPAHTLLHQSVEAAKLHPDTQAQAAFLNACLRRFGRERDALQRSALQQPLALWNFPAWWLTRLQQDYPQDWQHIARAANHSAPLQLRLNPARTDFATWQASLPPQIRARNFHVDTHHSGVELDRHHDVRQLPGYAAGAFSVQDAAAQWAAPLLLQGLRPPSAHAALRVLDACAAPGGKTAHLLEWAAAEGLPIQLTALEVDAKRAARISENLTRLQLHADIAIADARSYAREALANGLRFDAILLDAPCSASGIVRRHPDVRWLRRASDIAQLAKLQAQLLDALWPLLAPGGHLLYCVCSVFKAEGQAQIRAFLARNKAASLLPSPGHLIGQNQDQALAIAENTASAAVDLGSPYARSFPAAVSHDAFFYALLTHASGTAPVTQRAP